MKKKLLVLSASAILASNFILDNNASAVVRTTEHKSEALNMIDNESNSKQGLNYGSNNFGAKQDLNYGSNNFGPKQYIYYGSNSLTQQRYEDHFKDLTRRLSLNEHGGYDELEYKEAYQKYQDRFLGELDAFNKLILNLDSSNDGMTVKKYNKIRDSLIQNKDEFMRKVKEIESNNKNLERFTERDKEFSEGINKIYELEDQALMAMSSFTGRSYRDARDQLYYKLSLIVGSTDQERVYKLPTNRKMMDDMRENLESIIDEFFKDVKLERPKTIAPLTVENQDDVNAFKKVREDAQRAKEDESYRDPGVKERANKLKVANEKAKAEREAKAKELKEKGLLRGKAFTPQNYPLYFSHKKLKDHSQSDSKNELVFKETNEQPKELPTYTESITQTPQPVLKQQTKEEKVDVLKSKRPETTLNGLNGESNLVTIDESSNASTQFGSNGHVFEYSFDSTPKTTNVAKQNVKQENYNSVNNLAGMSGESQHVDFTQDSNPSTTYGGYGNAVDFTEDTAPKQPETITESHEIVLDYQTHATMSGFKTGVSTEAYYSSNELTK